MTAPLDPRREKYAGAITHHLPWGSPEQVDEATTAVMRVADRERQEMAAERFTWQERGDKAETRLRRAHQARRAKEHQLDGIRRALCDAGFMQDDDPYGHADLEDVIRQAGRLDELHAAVRADLEAEAAAEPGTCPRCMGSGIDPEDDLIPGSSWELPAAPPCRVCATKPAAGAGQDGEQ